MTDVNKWTEEGHATGYRATAGEIPHRRLGESSVLTWAAATAGRWR